MTIEDDISTHDAKEDGVYLVQVFEKEKFIKHAIFSVFDLAKSWIHELPSEYTCVCVPFVVDQPDAGERKEGELH